MRRVILSGGSRGIGEAIVGRFTENGDRVAFLYANNDDRAKAVEDKYCAYAIKASVADPESVKCGIEKAITLLGGCDILINNAGIAQSKLITDITDTDLDLMIETDLNGAFRCVKAIIPEFLKTHSGVIINISSMWGEVGASMEVHYSAAKAGLIGMTKAMAKELAPSGIRVNCVSPGMIDTDMNSCYDDEVISSVVEEIPLGRIGTPRDVANSVFFLASDEASYITGQNLGVNGGMVM